MEGSIGVEGAGGGGYRINANRKSVRKPARPAGPIDRGDRPERPGLGSTSKSASSELEYPPSSFNYPAKFNYGLCRG